MKIFDDVRVVRDREEYLKEGIHKGMVGYICMPEIRFNQFYVNFIDDNFEIHRNDPDWFEEHYDELKDDINLAMRVEDLELVKESDLTDEVLLKNLPLNDPEWWCKVENGYIMNLLGEKKNKIPYDYNS